MKNKRTNKGITLIALVITIIVMLILVAVTINMAINGGLFSHAGKAVGDTKNAVNTEKDLANGGIEIEGNPYNSIDEYLEAIKPMESYADTQKDENGLLTKNATYTSGGYTAVIPKGFAILEVNGEKSIEKGLVITDQLDSDGNSIGNEFVWVPVTKGLENSYSYNENFIEPGVITGDEEKGYTLEKFTTEYEKMVAGVNKYQGFYIGRYETTIDENSNVGSKNNASELKANVWADLYEKQKTANIEGNGTNIQSAMIYGVLWDETLAFITQNDKNYDVNKIPSADNDVALNILGLGTGTSEWTQEAADSTARTLRRWGFNRF